MAISDWSATAGSNTTVDAVSIAENCPPGNLNDAVRAVMANVRTWYSSFSAFVLSIVGSADAAAFRSAIGAASAADLAGSIPAGAIMWFARDTPPSGYLAANGANVSRTTYAGLFSAINTVFGAGDGTTTFTLPDLRGEFARGWDNGRGVDSGRAFGSAQTDLIKSHSHDVSIDLPGGGSGTWWGAGGGKDSTEAGIAFGGAETRPRNVALLACIKY